ncbi:MAG: PilZ domain-containing protein [Myxococcota bacterium]
MASEQEVVQAALGRAREARTALAPAVRRLGDAEAPERLRRSLARLVGALYAAEIAEADVVRTALGEALDALHEVRSGARGAPQAEEALAHDLLRRLESDLRLPLEALERAAAAPDLAVQVDQVSHHNFYAGFSGDIDEGGLFVVTYDVLPPGETLRVEIRLPQESPITTRAVVGWTRGHTAGAEPGMGLRLLDLDGRAREAIQRFMARREPLFHEE